MVKLYYRTFQNCMKWVSYLLPWREPELIEGANSIRRLPEVIKSKGIGRVLIVTDKGISSLGLMDELLSGLSDEGIKTFIFDKTIPNPTIGNIEEALEIYKANGCQGIIAFGGGSSMDCAKGIGARLARPNKPLPKMKGVLRVMKKLPPLFAVPTTAGTGSEATLAAVVTDPSTHEKYAINDVVLIPRAAVLDPALTTGLPPHLTSTTGMDALTHAVEAYIGKSNTRETKELGRKAVKLIFDHLYAAFLDGSDTAARENMLKASYYAGRAFTRAYVGYVHAIAHTLGGFYGVPHGLANAVILPYVLEYYGESVHKPLAELADLTGLGSAADPEEEKARKFIEAIRELNQKMGIPEKIGGILESDLPLMAERAAKEANPLYPVPKILFKDDLLKLYREIKE